MRILIGLAVAMAVTAPAFAKPVSVRGTIRRDGTYVAPHVRSSPNGTKLDNYSTKGNVNPYNGRSGTVNPTPNPTPTRR